MILFNLPSSFKWKHDACDVFYCLFVITAPEVRIGILWDSGELLVLLKSCENIWNIPTLH